MDLFGLVESFFAILLLVLLCAGSGGVGSFRDWLRRALTALAVIAV